MTASILYKCPPGANGPLLLWLCERQHVGQLRTRAWLSPRCFTAETCTVEPLFLPVKLAAPGECSCTLHCEGPVMQDLL